MEIAVWILVVVVVAVGIAIERAIDRTGRAIAEALSRLGGVTAEEIAAATQRITAQAGRLTGIGDRIGEATTQAGQIEPESPRSEG